MGERMNGSADGNDLGFRHAVRKSGEVTITRGGRPVTTLRGRRAERFLAEVEDATPAAVQQRLARLTGNYKRGNERVGEDRVGSGQ